MKKLLFFLFVSLIINFSWSQCAKPILVTPENVSTITDPYQLTFLHEIPKNYVDSLVYTLLHAKSLIDQQKIVETIAKTGTQEAFLLLWVASFHPLVFEDMNPFGTLCAIIDHSNGPSLLNKYFFKNRVKVLDTSNPQTDKYNFKQAILKECAKKKPKAYFCTVRNKAYTLNEMQQIIDNSFNEYIPCANPILITDKNMYAIHNPYELTFLHRDPQNIVDSVVYFLRFGPITLETKDLLQKMAESKLPEAFSLLYLSCKLSKKMDLGNNIFHSIANQIVIWGGFELLNKHFLDQQADPKHSIFYFRDEVICLADQKRPTLYYCHQPTVKELYDKEMADINPQMYDKQIIKIINRNSNTQNPESIKNIIKEVTDLPFVEDVLWDGCYEKLCIYPAYYHLMVIMNIDNKKVERYYSMKGAKFVYFGIRWRGKGLLGRTIETNKNKLVVVNTGYSPGAIDAARAYCETKKNEN